MISFIKGKIINKTLTEIVVLTNGGVGYQIAVNPRHLDKFLLNSEAEVLTYLVVREDAMNLYGFASEQEKQLFLFLISVSGVGPKSALHILSSGETEEIRRAIASGDVDYLSKMHGVGKKTAERISVELKDKMGLIVGSSKSSSDFSSNVGEVIQALMAMGYKEAQARQAVKNLDDSKNSEELLKEALKQMF